MRHLLYQISIYVRVYLCYLFVILGSQIRILIKTYKNKLCRTYFRKKVLAYHAMLARQVGIVFFSYFSSICRAIVLSTIHTWWIDIRVIILIHYHTYALRTLISYPKINPLNCVSKLAINMCKRIFTRVGAEWQVHAVHILVMQHSWHLQQKKLLLMIFVPIPAIVLLADYEAVLRTSCIWQEVLEQ